MGLRDLVLKRKYDSDEDDVLRDFYIPALSRSTKYKRLAGFFSSTGLAVAARGIFALVENGGTMQLVAGARLRKSDVEAIKKGILDRDLAIGGRFLKELKEMKSEFVKDHVRLLAWMIGRNLLEMKIAILTDEAGSPLDEDTVDAKGIYHLKVGVFEDTNGDVISFSGSINESASGWVRSVEEFKVFTSWSEGQSDYVQDDIRSFDRYWNGLANRVVVVELPTAIRQHLIEIAPDNLDELNIKKWVTKTDKELWQNQIQAIEAWQKNDYRGILAMATGSGKTLAALEASRLAPESVFTIVIVPTIPILKQWAKEAIPDFDSSAEIIVCGGGESEWKQVLPWRVAELRRSETDPQELRRGKRVYVVTTANTASSRAFQLTWSGIPSDRVQIIADEVHHLGAPMFRRCMELPAYRRMGLSATPEREWDTSGSAAIVQYFGHTVYAYGIKEAVRDGHLCHYRYYPFFAYMSQHEFDEFQRFSDEIAVEIAKWKNRNKNKEPELLPPSVKLSRLLEERARIKKKAEDKLRVFDEIMSGDIVKPLIVFCEDEEQLSGLKSVLAEKHLPFLIYTSQQSISERDIVMSSFKRGDCQVV
jgi:superfamily II DNA or RNA helicase